VGIESNVAIRSVLILFSQILLVVANAFVLFGLQAIPGVPRIKEGYNPATWMLDVTSNMVEQRLSIDFAEIYRRSDLHQ
jgi:hypothetical protein